MATVEMYAKSTCPYCIRAEALLRSKGVEAVTYNLDRGGPKRDEMIERSGRMTVPQIFIDGRHVGGCDDLFALERDGCLDSLLAAMSRIALLQARTGIDPARNAAALVEAVRQARAGGAEMLFTPEMSGLLDRDRSRSAPNLQREADDPVLAAVRNAASREGPWVHLGSLAVRRDDGLLANRAFVIDPAGEVRATYDKIHLFDVDLPNGESWRESASYAGGTSTVVVEGTPVGRLGLTICYDLRFPALFAALAEAGAEIIAVPAAFTVPTGKAHWEVLLRARAIEAGLIVAAAQAGTHEDGRETYGHSLVADPWGELVLSMDGKPGLGFVELDRARIAEVRSRVPALSHRRPIPAVERR